MYDDDFCRTPRLATQVAGTEGRTQPEQSREASQGPRHPGICDCIAEDVCFACWDLDEAIASF